MTTPQCVLDRNLVNENTITQMKDMGLSIFAGGCGKNRGAFVLDEPDGHTYSCLDLPASFSELAGIEIKEVNDIKNGYLNGDISPKITVDLLDLLVRHMYSSTPNNDKTLYSCDFSGLTTLEGCPPAPALPFPKLPIRAVSMSGVFAPTEFLTKPYESLTTQQAATFYTDGDFAEMAAAGINTVQIPIPISMIAQDTEATAVLVDYLGLIAKHNMLAFILLGSDPTTVSGAINAHAVAAANFCLNHKDVIMGMRLPIKSRTMMDDVQQMTTTQLPIFFPINEGEIEGFDIKWKQGAYPDMIFAALEMSHASTVADIASSSSREDRSKMFFHEATSCIIRAPMEFGNCYAGNTGIFVTSGFDLGVDNCIFKDLANSTIPFKDYGQCDRFDETIDSPWWHRHRQSLAARQIYAYEQGLGWSFAAWKLFQPAVPGVVSEPVDLLSLQTIIAADLWPSPLGATADSLACLNPPETDFIMGDDTYAPTVGPPPDCGNGWWNFDTKQCDYWVPPITDPPTAQPTISCPECEDCEAAVDIAIAQHEEEFEDWEHTAERFAGSVLAGLLLGLILGCLIPKCITSRRNSSEGYENVPDSALT